MQNPNEVSFCNSIKPLSDQSVSVVIHWVGCSGIPSWNWSHLHRNLLWDNLPSRDPCNASNFKPDPQAVLIHSYPCASWLRLINSISKAYLMFLSILIHIFFLSFFHLHGCDSAFRCSWQCLSHCMCPCHGWLHQGLFIEASHISRD